MASGICLWRRNPETAVGGVFAALRPPKPDRRAWKRGGRLPASQPPRDGSAASFCRQRAVCDQRLMNWRGHASTNFPDPEQPPAFLEFQLESAHRRPAPVGPLVELELGGEDGTAPHRMTPSRYPPAFPRPLPNLRGRDALRSTRASPAQKMCNRFGDIPARPNTRYRRGCKRVE
jgi:hypothetical protein